MNRLNAIVESVLHTIFEAICASRPWVLVRALFGFDLYRVSPPDVARAIGQNRQPLVGLLVGMTTLLVGLNLVD